MAKRDRTLLDYARRMRREPTRGERILWTRLRGRQFGVRFRRQEPIGPFIADFACIERRLVVEVDGVTHVEERDARRDRWFHERGWAVLRFGDDAVIEETDDVLDAIYAAIQAPRPKAGGTRSAAAQGGLCENDGWIWGLEAAGGA